jgi:hypothetical protein
MPDPGDPVHGMSQDSRGAHGRDNMKHLGGMVPLLAWHEVPPCHMQSYGHESIVNARERSSGHMPDARHTAWSSQREPCSTSVMEELMRRTEQSRRGMNKSNWITLPPL